MTAKDPNRTDVRPVDISADRLCRLLKATSDGKFEPTGFVLELPRGFVAALADNRTSKPMREKPPLPSPAIEVREKDPANLPDVSDVDAEALAKLRSWKR
ncbi:MAG: hypothetical protein KF708_22440 [Pirellulales bacterium]|nr:hypothetical protein [Pirellulales bacterium]